MSEKSDWKTMSDAELRAHHREVLEELRRRRLRFRLFLKVAAFAGTLTRGGAA